MKNKNIFVILFAFLVISFCITNASAWFAKLSYEDTYKDISQTDTQVISPIGDRGHIVPNPIETKSDTAQDYTDTTKWEKQEYPMAVIEDWWGIVGTKETIELVTHDKAFFTHPKDLIKVTLSNDANNLFQGIVIKDLDGNILDGKNPEIEDVNYEDYTEIVNDTEQQCNIVHVENSSGSFDDNVCTDIVIGNHEETKTREIVTPYSPLTVYTTGEHYFYVSATLNLGETADWVITSWDMPIDKMAVWNSSFSTGLVIYHNWNSTSNLLDGSHFNLTSDLGTGAFNGNQCKAGLANCGQFSGTNGWRIQGNQYTNLGSDANDYTINIWVNRNVSVDGTNHDAISACTSAACTSGGTNIFSMMNTMVMQSTSKLTGSTVNTPISAGQWIMITYVHNTTGYGIIYVNGTLASAGQSVGLTNGNFSLIFGHYRDGSEVLKGQEDELGIWNISLTANQISDLFNNNLALPFTNTTSAGALPSLNVSILNPANVTYTTPTIYFNITTSQNATCNYSLNSGVTNYTMTVNATATGFTASNSSIANGQYKCNAYCYDNNSIANLTQSVYFGVSNIPQISIILPSNITYTITPIYFNVSSNVVSTCNYTLNSGVTNYTMTANATNTGFTSSNSSIANGQYNFKAYCYDSMGAANLTQGVYFGVGVPPLVTILNPANTTYSVLPIFFNVTTNVASACNYSLNLGATNFTLTANVTNTGFTSSNNSIAQGQYRFSVTCLDSLGFSNNSVRVLFGYQVTPASTLTVSLANYPNNTITKVNPTCWFFNSSAVYSNGNLTNVTLYLSNNIVLTNFTAISQVNSTTLNLTLCNIPTGTYNWNAQYCGLNSSGNTNCAFATYNQTLIIDTINPVITVISPISNITNMATTNFSISASDAGSGLANASLIIYNSTSFCYQESANVSNQSGTDDSCGQQYIGKYVQSGFQSNPENMYDGNFSSYGYGGTIYINYTKPTSANSAYWKTKVSGINGNTNITQIPDRCFNSANNTIYLYLNSDIGGTVTAKCDLGSNNWYTFFSDNSGIQIYEEGIYWIIQDNNTIYNQTNFTVTTNKTLSTNQFLSDGTYLWSWSVYDLAGNLQALSNSIFVDATPPKISFVPPTLPSGTGLASLTIPINLSLTETNFANITFSIFNSTTSNSTTYYNLNYPTSFIVQGGGNYSYNVSVTDTANNFNSTETRTILIDLDNPNYLIITPIANLTNASYTNFTINLTDNVGLDNATFTIRNSTNTIINQTTIFFFGVLRAIIGIPLTLVDDVYTWGVSVINIAGNTNQTDILNYSVDTTPPKINFIPPTPVNGTTIGSAIPISLNLVEQDFSNITFNIWNATFRNSTTYYTLNYPDNIPISDGTYNFNVTVTDLVNLFNSTETRTVTVNTAAPNIIILNPTQIFNYGYFGQNVSLNFKISANLLDTCSFIYNNVSTVINCNKNTSFILVNNSKTITIFVNDTLGNKANATVTWNYSAYEVSRSFNYFAYTTSNQTFNLSFSSDLPALIASISLVYNGTAYQSPFSSNVSLANGSIYTTSSNIVVPATNQNNQNISFAWNLSFTDGTSFLTTPSYQVVNTTFFSICNGTNSGPISMNVTIYSEGTSNTLPANINIGLTYALSPDGQVLNSFSYNSSQSQSEYLFCISNNFTYYINGILSYYRNDSETRNYYFNNMQVSNVTQVIPLYLAQTASTNLVTFDVVDQNQQAVSDTLIYLQRWNIPTDDYSTVTMVQTGQDGKATVNIVPDNTFYRQLVYYEGILYLTTTAQTIPSTTTEIPLKINTGSANPYNQFNNVVKTLVFNNNTNNVLFTWSDSSGSVSQGTMQISKITGNSTQLLSIVRGYGVANTIPYTIVDNGTYLVLGCIKLISNYSSAIQCTDNLIISLGTPARFTITGRFGWAITLLLMGTMSFIGVAMGSIILGIVGIFGALIAAFYFGWLNFTSTGSVATGWFGAIVSIAVLVILSLKRRYG